MSTLNKDYGFQDIIENLSKFWRDNGCVLVPPSQVEISSPIFHPICFFQAIDNDSDTSIMYFQSQVSSKEYRNVSYEMKNYSFLKFQVFIKKHVENPQKIFFDSLLAMGFDFENSDIRFEGKNFNNLIFRLNSQSFSVFYNNIYIAGISYIQSFGNCESSIMRLSITYDIDRMLILLQDSEDIWNVNWDKKNNDLKYSDIMFSLEKENYDFIFDNCNNEFLFKNLKNYISISEELLSKQITIPAYTMLLKAKYCLDILNFRNFIYSHQKINYNKLLGSLIDKCCEQYLSKKSKEVNNE